jgi:type II secretory pathway pseudopilin PulG
MSTTKKLIKSAQRLLRNVLQLGNNLTKQVMNWLLRNLFVFRRHPNSSQAGFVLPTVIMVMLVVTLLTTAIVFRSFDRAKNASNVRVNQATLNAATPALDRAKAKIDALFEDPQLPRGTPSDISLQVVLNEGKYDYGDEQRVVLPFEFNDTMGIQRINDTASQAGTFAEDETVTTAWRFPVDTDNNGKFDSFTVYGIFFRTPSGGRTERQPVEARALPMDEEALLGAECAAAVGTTASLVGSNGWYKVGGDLKRAMFVYTATVPITDLNISNNETLNNNTYETYKGNKGFSALEMQEDIARTPLSNNAVIYEDDLEVFAGTDFTLNGRVITNSNLFVAEAGDPAKNPKFRQVSSRNSCFYDPENSKIVVGGNVGVGFIADSRPNPPAVVPVHLYQGTGDAGDPDVGTQPTKLLRPANKSTTARSNNAAYNGLAYEKRIQHLVTKATARAAANDPEEVKTEQEEIYNGTDAAEIGKARKVALDRYFRKRTRRVPYAEVPYVPNNLDPEDLDGSNSGITFQVDAGNNDSLRPPDDWIYPFDPSDGLAHAGYAEVALNKSGTQLFPQATDSEIQEESRVEQLVGDRVLVGNNLPALWWDSATSTFAGSDKPQEITGTTWNIPANNGPRTRKTRIEPISDAGDTGRDGFWEKKAQEQPQDELDPVGGLRIVTGAGLYMPDNDDISESGGSYTNASKIVWPDWMPVLEANTPDDINGKHRPYLKMRATAVYHYRHQDGEEPIACVATYYDPTNRLTAKNRRTGFGGSPPNYSPITFDVSGNLASLRPDNTNTDRRVPVMAQLRSLNGITYPPSGSTASTYQDELDYNADLFYPNGRRVNPLLDSARTSSSTYNRSSLSLAEQAAVDAMICAIEIRNGTLSQSPTPTSGYSLPHGTIQEIAFLNAKEVKSIDQNYDPADGTPFRTLTSRYNLPIEDRYPLEIRATVINLDNLRQNTAGSGSPTEYMLPNSGIIYATRDDALPDASDVDHPNDAANSNPRIAATDFLLDPTRRPNGIMLTNGRKLWRNFNTYREVEKGLILASNLPVYVMPDRTAGLTDAFNPHEDASGTAQQEFDTAITAASNDAEFYSRGDGQADRGLNRNFACRVGDPRLPTTSCQSTTADNWRPASILADSVTLLSADFRAGFRNEGDYDLRNNQIDNIADPDGDAINDIDPAITIAENRQNQGFGTNNFVTNGLSSDNTNTFTTIGVNIFLFDTSGTGYLDSGYSTATAGNPRLNSSYFNNGITPVQRRVADGTGFPEYVMEICQKLPVSECGASDWKVDPDNDQTAAQWLSGGTLGRPPSGTIAEAPTAADDQRYPRRIAFKRNNNGELVDNSNNVTTTANDLIVLGINNIGNVAEFSLSSTNLPNNANNALWYGTGANPAGRTNIQVLGATAPTTAEGQPRLTRVLQLQNTAGVSPTNNANATNTVGSVHWIPRATQDTIFNLVMATGDNPSRPPINTPFTHEGDIGGALSIFPRLLENWMDNAGTSRSVQIRGSFIQLKRSQYATAPYWQLPTANGTQQYRDGNQNKAPYYNAANRDWGFDVGLLSQIPDLFSQQFVLPSEGQPNIFYREVSRNDPWVQTLLCAAMASPSGGSFTYQKALNDSERPTCPTF